MATSKRLRYEVLRRDNHACRYCGATAPDVKLTIDHVVPVTLGGTDEPANLVTACVDCNGGKSSASPDSAIVADVSADALRWSNALKHAADALMADRERRQKLRDQFNEKWCCWTYKWQGEEVPLDRPADWGNSVDTILAAGLPMEILFECVDIAMAAKHVHGDKVFRYMCGIAWRRVGELRAVAGVLLEANQET